MSCLNLRASAERTCNKKTKSGPTFYVLYMFCNFHFLLRKICFVAQQIYYKVLWWISSTTPATIVDWCIGHLPNWCLLHNSRRKYRVDSDWNSDTVALYHTSTYILTYGQYVTMPTDPRPFHGYVHVYGYVSCTSTRYREHLLIPSSTRLTPC